MANGVTHPLRWVTYFGASRWHHPKLVAAQTSTSGELPTSSGYCILDTQIRHVKASNGQNSNGSAFLVGTPVLVVKGNHNEIGSVCLVWYPRLGGESKS